MIVEEVTAQKWPLALHSPFVIAQRTANEASNVLISMVASDDALSGYGESAPVGYVTGESVESVLQAVEAVRPHIIDKEYRGIGPVLKILEQELWDKPAARAGLEMAYYDLWGHYWNLPMWQFFGGEDQILTTDLTIPLVAPETAAETAEKAWSEGFRDFKIKIGDSLGDERDFERILAVKNRCPYANLRLDANQAFTPEQAVEFVKGLGRSGVDLAIIEQPVHKDDFDGLKYVKDHVDIPVFADESARDMESILKLLKNDMVDGINIKLMKLGIRGSLRAISLCKALDKKVMIGCMLESPLGIAAAAQIAGGTGTTQYVDLDSCYLLKQVPKLRHGFISEGGTFKLDNLSPGWGVFFENQAGIL